MSIGQEIENPLALALREEARKTRGSFCSDQSGGNLETAFSLRRRSPLARILQTAATTRLATQTVWSRLVKAVFRHRVKVEKAEAPQTVFDPDALLTDSSGDLISDPPGKDEMDEAGSDGAACHRPEARRESGVSRPDESAVSRSDPPGRRGYKKIRRFLADRYERSR